MSDSNPNITTFALQYPFDFRGISYTEFKARRPKTRDIRQFIKGVEKDGFQAVEKILSNLFEVEEVVVAEIDAEDFAPMRAWVDGFLQKLLNVSQES